MSKLYCEFFFFFQLTSFLPKSLLHPSNLLESIGLPSISGCQTGILPFNTQIFTSLQYGAAPSTLSLADTWVRRSWGQLRECVFSPLLGLGWGPVSWLCHVGERTSTMWLSYATKESTDSSISSLSPRLCLQRYLVPWCLSLPRVLQSESAALWLASSAEVGHPAFSGWPSQVSLTHPLNSS